MYFIYKKRSAGFARRALRTSLPPPFTPLCLEGGQGIAKLRSRP